VRCDVLMNSRSYGKNNNSRTEHLPQRRRERGGQPENGDIRKTHLLCVSASSAVKMLQFDIE